MRLLSLIVLGLPIWANAQIITTIAGNGIAGPLGDGGQATIAELNLPEGLYIDNNDHLLICHQQLVRSVNLSTGIISSIAGSDTASSLGGGGDGGSATCANLVNPYTACSDISGNLYIADSWYSEIRKVTISTGIIDTFAGTRTVGNTGDGGPAKNATFNTIFTVCIDTNRNIIYVSDEFNHRVRKINISTNIIYAYAGTGTNGYSGDDSLAINAKFSRVLGLALDRSGNLYIGDWDNGRIRKVDVSTGIVTTFAGNGTVGYSGDGGPATAAMFNKPTALCFDSCGNLYLSDENNQRVRKIDMDTKIITTVAGKGTTGFSGDSGLADSAEFNHPTGICIDKYGSLYVSDFNNQRVRKVAFDTICTGNISLYTNKIVNKIQVSIFPNPAYNNLTITSSGIINTISITNPVGQTVFSQTYNIEKAQVNIAGLPPGVYIVKVTDSEGKVTVSKIVKQ
jgi:sugar lactone lactonase YvrE